MFVCVFVTHFGNTGWVRMTGLGKNYAIFDITKAVTPNVK